MHLGHKHHVNVYNYKYLPSENFDVMMLYKKWVPMVFPSAYVQVRQLGAWKLHPYNSIALIQSGTFSQSLESFSNFEVMTVMCISS